MIAALARAGWVLKEDKYVNMAIKANNFIFQRLFTGEKMLHRYREDESGISGNLDDYSFFTWGLLELYEATYQIKYLKEAINMAELMIKYFWDKSKGGFFNTPEYKNDIIIREKKVYDGSVPSGNSVSMFNLIRLYHFTGDINYKKKAEHIVKIFSDSVNNNPSSFSQFLNAYISLIGPFYDIVITGKKDDNKTNSMINALRDKYIPNSIILFKTIENKTKVNEIANYVKGYKPISGEATAFICKDFSCNLPTNNIEEMLTQIK